MDEVEVNRIFLKRQPAYRGLGCRGAAAGALLCEDLGGVTTPSHRGDRRARVLGRPPPRRTVSSRGAHRRARGPPSAARRSRLQHASDAGRVQPGTFQEKAGGEGRGDGSGPWRPRRPACQAVPEAPARAAPLLTPACPLPASQAAGFAAPGLAYL